MKKLVFILIMLLTLTGCASAKKAEPSNETTQNKASYERLMYFEKYRNMRANEDISMSQEAETTIEMYGTVMSLFEEDAKISALFEEAKDDIRVFFEGVNFFDWEKFENSELKQMKEDYYSIEGREGGADAAYLPKENYVAVYRIVREYPDWLAKETIAHELIHSLTENETTATNPAIYEGLTEVLSAQLYQKELQAYTISCNFVTAYMRVLGVEDATKGILNGQIFADIDSKTVPNAMEDASKSIFALDMGYGSEEDYLLCIDLLADYAINTGIIEEIASGILGIQWSNPEVKAYFEWRLGQRR